MLRRLSDDQCARLKYVRAEPGDDLSLFPDFLVVGPQRTGTTWLHSHLRDHPEIMLSEPKEIFFFNRLKTPNHPKFQSAELSWYLKFFREAFWVRAWKSNRCRRRFGVPYCPRVKGEATASYAALEPDVIEEIAVLNPEMRVVLMIRDPVERAWSHAKKDLARSRARRLEEVGEQELMRFFKDEYQLRCARYADNFENWRSRLRPGHLFVGRFDDIGLRPHRLLLDVMTFLGVESSERFIHADVTQAVNPTAGDRIPAQYRAALEELLRRNEKSWHDPKYSMPPASTDATMPTASASLVHSSEFSYDCPMTSRREPELRRKSGAVLVRILLRRGCFAAFMAVLLLSSSVALAAEAPDPLFDQLEDEYAERPPGFPDPIEPFNRYVLAFNQEFDQWVLDPITRVYRFILPDQVKRAVQRGLTNLNSPGVTINDTLQCEFEDAGITLWRFIINSTFGIAGLFDPASYLGVPGHSSDFDQTLALYGVPSGAFLMLPVFGPTTVRGGLGTIVDTAMRPTTYFLAGTEQFVFAVIHGGSSGLATREASLDAIEDLQESSIDYYASLRNAYYQKRMGDIWWRRDRNRQRAASSKPSPAVDTP